LISISPITKLLSDETIDRNNFFLKKETTIKSPSRFRCLATIKIIKNKQEFINKYISKLKKLLMKKLLL